MPTILCVGGGSIGHIAPAVAVARALQERDLSLDVVFVCTPREEERMFLKQEGYACETLTPPRGIGSVITFPLGFIRSWRMLSRHHPAAVFCKGGAVAVPLCAAAKLRKIPMIVHESDAVMGRANAIVARWARAVCLGFPHLQSAIPNPIVTGNPIRSEISRGNKAEGLRITGLGGEKPVLLVSGGSQGAQALNEAVIKHLDELLSFCDIIHLTGKGKEANVKRAGYWSKPFATTELPHLYAASDLALGRAGAGSIGELAANGIPAILVPIRGLAHDHQMRNATAAQENGGCILLLQEHMDEKIVDMVRELSIDAPMGAKISQKARAFYNPDAARRIAEIILECVASWPARH